MESANISPERKQFQVHEVTMNAAQLPSRRKTNTDRKTRQAPRPVPELLLEIAYRLHASKVVERHRVPRSLSGASSSIS